MHENEGLETYQVSKNLIKHENPLGKRLGLSEKGLGDERQKYWEKDRQKLYADRTRRIYRPSVNLDRWRCRENGCRQMQVSSMCRATNHHIKNRSSINRPNCREAIEETGTFSIDPPSVEEVSSKLLKQFFEKRKILTWMQSNMQHNQWSRHHINLSKSSLNKNFKHMDPKNTHTHTLNKSNQFYISKTSQNNLVSIH